MTKKITKSSPTHTSLRFTELRPIFLADRSERSQQVGHLNADPT